MSHEALIQQHQAKIEEELKAALQPIREAAYSGLHAMMAYHLGWEGPGAGPKASGKRVRPLLVTLTCAAAGGDWRQALPAAVSVELIHNFSLLHDDIEDNSPLRRGRPTVWTQWGIPQAINTGDSMFSLAHLALHRLQETTSAKTTLRASQILENTCLQLTQGQFLDIAYENRENLGLDDYWPMVSGKTAALIAACTELGALVAGAPEQAHASYRDFGLNLGLAFQVLDDYLGIWGEPAKTGKSAASDLLERKKSLPVLFGLGQRGLFARRWTQGPVRPEEVADLAAILAQEGAQSYTQESANHLTNLALQALEDAGPQGEAGQCLSHLAHQLLQREE
jgi:geranylgeranyl diphosphate synthase type I